MRRRDIWPTLISRAGWKLRARWKSHRWASARRTEEAQQFTLFQSPNIGRRMAALNDISNVWPSPAVRLMRWKNKVWLAVIALGVSCVVLGIVIGRSG